MLDAAVEMNVVVEEKKEPKEELDGEMVSVLILRVRVHVCVCVCMCDMMQICF